MEEELEELDLKKREAAVEEPEVLQLYSPSALSVEVAEVFLLQDWPQRKVLIMAAEGSS